MKEIIIHAPSVLFYSMLDEEMFFKALEAIPSISAVDGEREVTHIHVNPEVLTWHDLRNLIGICERHNIDMHELTALESYLTVKEQTFFRNKDAYWYAKVFR